MREYDKAMARLARTSVIPPGAKMPICNAPASMPKAFETSVEYGWAANAKRRRPATNEITPNKTASTRKLLREPPIIRHFCTYFVRFSLESWRGLVYGA